MAWKLTYDGEVYREVDLTLAQAEAIEEKTGTTWRVLNPLHSAKHAKVVLAVCLSERKGLDYGVAEKIAAALKIDEFLEMYEVDNVDDLPSEYDDGIPRAGVDQ